MQNAVVGKSRILLSILLVFASLPLSDRAVAVSKTSVEYYSITGNTFNELASQMQQRGPSGFWAFTRYDISYSYSYTPSNAGCVLSRSTIDIATTITMPEWEGKQAASAEMQREWERLYDAMWQHEKNHQQIGLDAYNELKREFTRLRRQANCGDFAGVLNGAFAMVDSKADARNIQYDTETNHGRTEGVGFNSFVEIGNSSVPGLTTLPSDPSSSRWYWWFLGLVGALLFLKNR